jgi:hypothetical protein
MIFSNRPRRSSSSAELLPQCRQYDKTPDNESFIVATVSESHLPVQGKVSPSHPESDVD